MAQGQAPGYELLERHMDYHARMMRLWTFANEALRQLGEDLERDAKEQREARERKANDHR